jgi:hypothetical protein
MHRDVVVKLIQHYVNVSCTFRSINPEEGALFCLEKNLRRTVLTKLK